MVFNALILFLISLVALAVSAVPVHGNAIKKTDKAKEFKLSTVGRSHSCSTPEDCPDIGFDKYCDVNGQCYWVF